MLNERTKYAPRTQAPPVMVGATFGVIFSLVAMLPATEIVEKTIEGSRMATLAAWLGVLIIGIPLCWFFRGRRYYGNEFHTQRVLVWFLLLVIGAINSANLGILLNAYAGQRAESTLDSEILGFQWFPKHQDYYLEFRFPDAPAQKIELRSGEKRMFNDQKLVHLQIHSGLFGFPVIASYGLLPTNNAEIRPDNKLGTN